MRSALIFDLDAGGHHAEYFRHLLSHVADHGLDIDLAMLVGAAFESRHPGVVSWARELGIGVHIGQTAPPDHRVLGLLQRSLSEWQVLVRHAKELNIDHVFSLYADRLIQGPLAFDLPMPFSFSGIYFRPTFHYSKLGVELAGFAEHARAYRQAVLLRQALKNAGVNSLYTLDRFAVQYVSRSGWQVPSKLNWIPDPIDTKAPKGCGGRLRGELGIGSDELLLLLFGSLSPRKGAVETLRALEFLSAATLKRICLVLVGNARTDFETELERAIERARDKAGARVVRRNEYVAAEDVQEWFEGADLVLLPYQRHVGMSGVLLRAAVAGRPVLTQKYGLVGMLVREYDLGITVDARSSEALANGIEMFVSPEFSWDPAGARKLAAEHRADLFARTILQDLSGT